MRYSGIGVVPGISNGPLWAPPMASASPPGGMAAFEAARRRFLADAARLPDDLSATYEAIVLDSAWDEGVARGLQAGASLGSALQTTAEGIAGTLERLDDPYLRARAADFIQLGAQLTRLLGDAPSPPSGSILCARDVSAVELVQWAPSLAGVVLFDVAPTAHVAIVARGLGLPTIALARTARDLYERAERGDEEAAATGVLNGFEGWLETNAGSALLERFPAERIVAEADPAPVNVGGRSVGVFANINLPDDAPLAAALGADGIGLLRTEFLYAGRPDPPPLDEERAAYAQIAARFRGRPIIVRTLDLGGDKVGAGIEHDGLDHGMLGVRGIRLTLRRPELFAQHLRAVLEGFAGADLRLMFPMVTLPEEFARAREIVGEVVRDIGAAAAPRLGIMLEVPAAAFALDEFAREGVSFISLGTNDLAQYFFASDRLSLEGAIDPATSDAFRTFVAETVARAQRAGLEVGVCGEAAASALLTPFWLACGVDELSVAPGLVPWLKGRLRDSSLLPAKEHP